MATVTREVLVRATPEAVWDAVRDVGALHERLVPGFVTATVMEATGALAVRRVTFASGLTLRERIVAVDDAALRLVWAIEADGVDHHNGALSVSAAEQGGARVVWTADVLPHALADQYGPLMEAGLAVMAAHLASPA